MSSLRFSALLACLALMVMPVAVVLLQWVGHTMNDSSSESYTLTGMTR